MVLSNLSVSNLNSCSVPEVISDFLSYWYQCWSVHMDKISSPWFLNLCPYWGKETVERSRRGSKGDEMGEFPPPPAPASFFWAPFFLFFFLSLKYWLFLLHYYKNSPPPPPPISKSGIRGWGGQSRNPRHLINRTPMLRSLFLKLRYLKNQQRNTP